MLLTKPTYYDAFRCIAGDCPDSCCKEWDVQVDETAAAYYRGLEGKLGDRLRQVLRDVDGETVMSIENGRCPMWRQDGLCQIQAELGEEALCRVCREFPRLRHEYGDYVELGLELSCPEAARLILQGGTRARAEVEDGQLQTLLDSREQAFAILDAPSRNGGEALAAVLLYGYQAQEELDFGGGEPGEISLENGRELAKEPDYAGIFQFFRGLEILTPQWQTLLEGEIVPALPPQTKALARYLIDRYWLQAYADGDLVSRVKFVVIACILVGAMGGDYTRTAQLFSKEIENDADNVDAILDAAYTCPAFTDDKLLGALLL